MDDLERAREVWRGVYGLGQFSPTAIGKIIAFGKQERDRALEEAAQRMMDWEGDWNAAKLAYAIRALKERKP